MIKFRVWDPIKQSYSGGDLWKINARGVLYYGNAEWPEGIVEQYTGLKDKNETEIYEGDIVRDVDTGKIFEIKYHHNMFIRYEKETSFMFFTVDESCLEVIGNIYEVTHDT